MSVVCCGHTSSQQQCRHVVVIYTLYYILEPINGPQRDLPSVQCIIKLALGPKIAKSKPDWILNVFAPTQAETPEADTVKTTSRTVTPSDSTVCVLCG